MGKTLHILMLVAFLGGIIAPACGFAWGGKYSVVEICTAQGIESRVVDSGESNTPSHNLTDQCQFCFAHANLVSFLPHVPTMEFIKFAREKQKFQTYEIIFLTRLNTQTAPRGPPAFV